MLVAPGYGAVGFNHSGVVCKCVVYLLHFAIVKFALNALPYARCVDGRLAWNRDYFCDSFCEIIVKLCVAQ